MDSTLTSPALPRWPAAPLALALLAALVGCPEPVPPDCVDSDGDGYGHGDHYRGGCAAGDEADCDDEDATRNPGAAELCDDIDNNCDGTVDGEDELVWMDLYPDFDGDGYGDAAATALTSCSLQENYVEDATDCDDGDENVHPGAEEVPCDGADNDCDDATGDEPDLDGDGFSSCDGIAGGGDCNDEDATVYPDAVELCDGLDNDCDEQRPGDETDGDGDGYVECTVDADGWDGDDAVLGGDDCDDDDDTVNPDAMELCDGLDNDCDGDPDTAEADDDGDGYVECTIGDGGWAGETAPDGGDDCDDGDATVHPGAVEGCDGVDTDCDGVIPEDEEDDDGDGYATCAGDCDDNDPSRNPGAFDMPTDGVDQDCDGGDPGSPPAASLVAWWPLDGDADDHGGNGHDGTPQGTRYTRGVIGQAMAFGGSDSWVLVPHEMDLSLSFDHTIMFWIRADRTPDGLFYVPLSKKAYNQDQGWAIEYESTGEISWIWPTPDNELETQGAASFAAWHHVAVVFESGQRSVYLDGVLDSSTPVLQPPPASADDLYLGTIAGAPDTEWNLDGRLDEVMLFEEPLDAGAIGAYVGPLLDDADGDGWPMADGDCDDFDATRHPHAVETPGDGVDQDCDQHDACADLDCDGWTDLLFVQQLVDESVIYWGSEDGYSTSDRLFFVTDDSSYDVSLGDVDGDGFLDMVFAEYCPDDVCDYGTPVWFGQPNGVFSPSTPLQTLGARATLLSDLDQDGWVDLVFANHYDLQTTVLDSYIYWGGPGGYSLSHDTVATHGPEDVCAADLDGDGYQELLFASYIGDNADYGVGSDLYWGAAAGFPAADHDVLPSAGAMGCAIADVIGDGHLDLLLANGWDGAANVDAMIYEGDNAWSFSTPQTLPSDRSQQFAVDDLDGDGAIDVVVANFGDWEDWEIESLIYWGPDFLASDATGLATVGAAGVLVADLDEDGFQDVVFANKRANDHSLDVMSVVYWGPAFDRITELPTHSAVQVAAAGHGIELPRSQ